MAKSLMVITHYGYGGRHDYNTGQAFILCAELFVIMFADSWPRGGWPQTTKPKGPEDNIMWRETMDSWGYGGYGPFHTVIWIILGIVIVAGIVWRIRSGSW